jgi:hypothetical protein
MKSLVPVLLSLTVLFGCTNSGESGAVNDGDSPGRAKNKTINPPADPATDTSKGEHRVDIQKRDSFN